MAAWAGISDRSASLTLLDLLIAAVSLVPFWENWCVCVKLQSEIYANCQEISLIAFPTLKM